MAAPYKVYQDKMLKIEGDSDINIYVAKALLNDPPVSSVWGNGYFNADDSVSTAISKIKNIFALDDVSLIVGKDEDGKTFGFVGLLDPEGALAGYHNSNKISGMAAEGVTSLQYLNDAGLNTKPFPSISGIGHPKWANWINIELILQSAFYLSTSVYGYAYKIGSGGSWVEVPISTLGAKTYREEVVKIRDLSSSLEEGDYVYFRCYATNAEGTSISLELERQLDAPIMMFGANLLALPDDPITGGINIFSFASAETNLGSVTESDADTGIFFYKSEYFNAGNYVDDGYYIIGGQPLSINGKTRVFYIQNGEVRRYAERTELTAMLNLYIMKQNFESEFYDIVASTMFTDNGFPNSMSIGTITEFFDSSYNQVGTSYSKNLSVVQGAQTASTPMLSPPPIGAVYAKTITNTTGIGLQVISNYVPL